AWHRLHAARETGNPGSAHRRVVLQAGPLSARSISGGGGPVGGGPRSGCTTSRLEAPYSGGAKARAAFRAYIAARGLRPGIAATRAHAVAASGCGRGRPSHGNGSGAADSATLHRPSTRSCSTITSPVRTPTIWSSSQLGRTLGRCHATAVAEPSALRL